MGGIQTTVFLLHTDCQRVIQRRHGLLQNQPATRLPETGVHRNPAVLFRQTVRKLRHGILLRPQLLSGTERIWSRHSVAQTGQLRLEMGSLVQPLCRNPTFRIPRKLCHRQLRTYHPFTHIDYQTVPIPADL